MQWTADGWKVSLTTLMNERLAVGERVDAFRALKRRPVLQAMRRREAI